MPPPGESLESIISFVFITSGSLASHDGCAPHNNFIPYETPKHSLGYALICLERGDVSCKMDIAAVLWKDSRPMRDRRPIRFLPFVYLFVLMLMRPVTGAAAPASGAQETTDSQVNLPQGTGWEDWEGGREQHTARPVGTG